MIKTKDVPTPQPHGVTFHSGAHKEPRAITWQRHLMILQGRVHVLVREENLLALKIAGCLAVGRNIRPKHFYSGLHVGVATLPLP